MEYTTVSNPQWVNAEQTAIQCDVIFPAISDEPIEFCASVNDVEPHGVEIFSRCAAGSFGAVAAYVAAATPAPTTDQLLAALASLRWQVETGGYVYTAWPVDSDDRSQFKALAEVLRIQSGQRADGDVWKFADGEFRSMTNNEFMAMYSVGVAHVEKCFASEAACKTRIEAGGTDIETIWAEEWALL